LILIPSKSKNKQFINSEKPRLFEQFRQKKSWQLQLQNRDGSVDHYYDDDIVQTIAEEFLDRISVTHLIGDIVRALGGVLGMRPTLSAVQLHSQVLKKIIHDNKVSRKDVASFTNILPVDGNSMISFMNGGPMGEHWNTSPNGLYDWIDNKSSKSIIGIELGFKADEYGLEVSKRLIAKKQNNPEVYVGLLIDGFVSAFIPDPDVIDDFQNKTITMINQMKSVGIDVRINDSWNPLSSDFLAANHVKLWIFDGKAAFVGGIGIESQFIKTLYDQMDLIQGPFVRTLTLMSFLLMANQRRQLVDRCDEIQQIYEMDSETIHEKFLPEIAVSGSLSMEISVNVPGYVQDAQKDYYSLLLRDNVSEIFIMAPYFSDDKIARALIVSAKRLEKKQSNIFKTQIKSENPNISDEELKNQVTNLLEKNKKVHIIFPKKQENAIIEQVSKYYAHCMKDISIVETKQFVVDDGDAIHEMLHAKQMVVVFEKDNKKDYVKFGGSYNPAGRAHNMWEVNNLTYLKNIDDDDANLENPVKDYLDNVFWKILNDYSEPFRWGQKDVKLNAFELFMMKFAQVLFF